MITWDDSMTTGVPAIDAQHQEIIRRYNTLAEAMASNRMLSMDEAAETLDFLQFYAVWHFEREEACFEQYRCPAAAANKEAHAQFIAMFGQFYTQWQETGLDSALAQETFSELGRWIEHHIRRTDTQLLPCVRAQSAED